MMRKKSKKQDGGLPQYEKVGSKSSFNPKRGPLTNRYKGRSKRIQAYLASKRKSKAGTSSKKSTLLSKIRGKAKSNLYNGNDTTNNNPRSKKIKYQEGTNINLMGRVRNAIYKRLRKGGAKNSNKTAKATTVIFNRVKARLAANRAKKRSKSRVGKAWSYKRGVSI